jgi:hypothetical protein
MGILGRLGNVVKSYLNDDNDNIFGKGRSGNSSPWSAGGNDSDLNAAYEELEDFLSRGRPDGKKPAAGTSSQTAPQMPAELRADFAELGLSPPCSPAECKAAYKKLLKIHHPDRHAGNSDAMKKATEKTARVNAAYRRIETWQKK